MRHWRDCPTLSSNKNNAWKYVRLSFPKPQVYTNTLLLMRWGFFWNQPTGFMLKIQLYSFQGYLTKDVQKNTTKSGFKSCKTTGIISRNSCLFINTTNSTEIFLHIWSCSASILKDLSAETPGNVFMIKSLVLVWMQYYACRVSMYSFQEVSK